MLPELVNPVLKIVSVDRISWEKQSCSVRARDFSALAFRVKGSASIRYQDKTVTADTGDLLYLPQGLMYRADYGDTEILVIHFVAEKADGEVEVYHVFDQEKIYKLFLKAYARWKSRLPGTDAIVMSLLYEILGGIASESKREVLPQPFVEAVSRLNSGFRLPELSVSAVCRASGIGETYFRKLFRQEYGKTPVLYVTELRLEEARSMISGGFSVEEAALSCGFRDPKYFARVVKKRWGCTPKSLKNYGK